MYSSSTIAPPSSSKRFHFAVTFSVGVMSRRNEPLSTKPVRQSASPVHAPVPSYDDEWLVTAAAAPWREPVCTLTPPPRRDVVQRLKTANMRAPSCTRLESASHRVPPVVGRRTLRLKTMYAGERRSLCQRGSSTAHAQANRSTRGLYTYSLLRRNAYKHADGLLSAWASVAYNRCRCCSWPHVHVQQRRHVVFSSTRQYSACKQRTTTFWQPSAVDLLL